jgi:hypothetical protein
MRLSPWMRWVLYGAAALLLLFYCADWAVLRIRLARGGGLDSIQVRHFMSTPLKGNRAEYDLVDSAEEPCVRAALPHGGLAPCWWLRMHRDQWQSI